MLGSVAVARNRERERRDLPRSAYVAGFSRRLLSRAPALSSGGRILAPIVPLVVVAYMFLLLPIETRLRVLGVSLPIFRIGLLLFVPFLLARFAGGRTRPILADWLILLSAGWILISFGLHYGLNEGLIRGFGVVTDYGGSYALARLAINSPHDLRRFLIMISPGMFFAGTIMMIESLGHQLFYRPFFADLLGGATLYELGEAVGILEYDQSVRAGLMRAYGPFSHPILGGAVLVSLLPLWLLGGLRSWPKWLGLASAFMGIFSLSSAAFLGLGLGLALVATDWGKGFVKGIGWPAIAAGAVVALVAIDILSNRPLGSLIANYTLSPQTAHYRTLIWEYGGKVVAENPWIGIGYGDWARPDWMSISVDAHFLALAMRNGLPAVVLLIFAILAGMTGTGLRALMADRRDRDLLVGMNFTVVILVFCAITVMLFGEASVFFMMMIGICGSMTAGVRLDRTGSIVLDSRIAQRPTA